MIDIKLEPKEVFLSNIKNKIKGLLINNLNYTNGYYYSKQIRGIPLEELIRDIKEKANYILEEIDKTEHLIK